MRSFSRPVLLSALLGLTALSASTLVTTAQADEPLKLGVDIPFEPFEYRLPDGTLTGFEVELGEEVSAHPASM
ncbi:hypothetical protein [Halomonas sp. DP8Y7-3]|uniref:hypothetical protein n=1 Tax=Halomonas sp. DP8Y7-3 TaxID=2859079 RepID=UPI00396581B5